MPTAAPALASAPPASLAEQLSPPWLAAAVIVLGVAARITPGIGTPLWFDETFSAVIASQPNVATLVDWCRSEIGGPVYYILLWLWAQAFGTSALALRSLSFVASLAAPALVAWRGHPDRATRLTWATLMLLWLPAMEAATNARPYALATLAAAAQAIAYWRMMQAPTRARALAWTGISAVAILTHNHCAVIAGVGGVIFVAVYRARALRCWPALAPLSPMVLWLAYQFPVLAKFGAQGAWYPPFGVIDVALAPTDLFESVVLGLLLSIGPVVTFAKGWRAEHALADRALAASGVVAFAAVLALALARPSFTWRYAIPFGPAILFGVTIWVRGLSTRFAVAPALVIALFGASALGRVVDQVAKPGDNARSNFNLVTPSDWITAHGTRHLALLWQGPTGAMSDPARLGEVAGYFVRRHRPVAVTVLRAPQPARPAQVVATALRRDPSIDSMIWIADRQVPHTGPMPDRRMMAALGWICRDFAREPMHMLGCYAPEVRPTR